MRPRLWRSLVLGIVVWSVGSRGISSLNWDFFTKGPALFGESGGGIAPAIVGSLAPRRDRHAVRAAVRCAHGDLRERVRLGVDRTAGAALARRAERVPVDRDRHLRVHARRQVQGPGPRHRAASERDRRRLRALDHHAAARRSRDDGGARSSFPNDLREASYALGVSKWQTVLRVVLPTSFGGILTGTTLAIARAAGETAPLLFTCAIAGNARRLEPDPLGAVDPAR